MSYPAKQPLRVLLRIAIFASVVLVLGCACLMAAYHFLLAPAGGDGELPVEALALQLYLVLHANDLNRPVAPFAPDVDFEVEPGESAADIAERLYERGLIWDADLFRRYVRFHGLDSQLEAGHFRLSASMTIPEIAEALTSACPVEIVVQVIEGWRMEQIGELIDTLGLAFSGAEFLALVGPGAERPDGFDFLAEIPPGGSLEGYLFPDTYRLAPDATPQELRDAMLRNFDSRVTPQMRADAAASGFTLYQVVTLASIVEREAIVPDERPLIASVYLNRLARGMNLDADPTVQYAIGYRPETGRWWNHLTFEDYTAVDSPYNTYLHPGLPPGPIANPGLDSIRAVIYPASTEFLYFRATCDGTGRHNFATTFEEHLANECP